jgi:hypothetical protein
MIGGKGRDGHDLGVASKTANELSDDACLTLAEVALTRPAPMPETTKQKLRASAEEYIARTTANKLSGRTNEHLQVASKASSEKSGASTTAATELAIIPIGAKARPVWTRSSVLLAAAAAALVWITGGAIRYSTISSVAGERVRASVAYECVTSDGSSHLTIDASGGIVEPSGSLELQAAFDSDSAVLNIGKDNWPVSSRLTEKRARPLSLEAHQSLLNSASNEVFIELGAPRSSKATYRFSCRKKP